MIPIASPWHRLPNGNLLHCCGIELVNDGCQWRMTDESGRDFEWFAIREQGLSCDEAQGLAELLVAQGASWADHGLH
jgi:hypothetical protein